MKLSYSEGLVVCVLVSTIILPGCTTTYGARTVPEARFDYNENIVKSRDEQMLVNLVRVSKDKTTFFLDVTEVNTAYEYTGNTSAKLSVSEGDGRKDTTTDTSTTVDIDAPSGQTTQTTASEAVQRVSGLPSTLAAEASAGVVYAEKPTITYKPLQGTKFAARLMSPLHLELLLYLVESGRSIDRVLDCCIHRINGIHNGRIAKVVRNRVVAGGDLNVPPAGYEEFQSIAEYLLAAQKDGFVWFERAPSSPTDDVVPDRAWINIDCDARTDGEHITNVVLSNLGLDPVCPRAEHPETTSTSSLRPGVRVEEFEGDDIRIFPRSLIGFMRALATQRSDDKGVCGGNDVAIASVEPNALVVCSSQNDTVHDGLVRTFYEDRWYWISDDDKSQKTFGLLTELFDLQASMEAPAGPALSLGLR